MYRIAFLIIEEQKEKREIAAGQFAADVKSPLKRHHQWLLPVAGLDVLQHQLQAVHQLDGTLAL